VVVAGCSTDLLPKGYHLVRKDDGGSADEFRAKTAICNGTEPAAPSERVEACTWLLENGLHPEEWIADTLCFRAESGDYDGAVADFEKSLEVDPAHHDALFSLAWLHAAGDSAAHRNGLRAVALARRAVALHDVAYTRWGLAAAYAAAGQFDIAVREQKAATAMAVREGYYSDATIEEQERRLLLFRQGRTLVD